jgi:glycosyltransferase involved in cell wall biosynthesis
VNIIECHFEFGGFDDRLVRGGISVYLWNLCRQFRATGQMVTGLTAAHGLLPEIRHRYEIEDLSWSDHAEIPMRLDPQVWHGFPEWVTIPATVTAHRLRVDGVDVVILAGGPLDEHTATFYPPYELKGKDLSFLKPLVFQVMASRFLRATAAAGDVVHLHEPYYHYLVPAALEGREMIIVSSVQSNMPVNKKVYGPEVRTLLRYLGADPAVADGLSDPPLDTPAQQAMRAYLPGTLLYNDYPERPGHDYVSVLGLVLRSAHALDFLSQGQLEHVVTQSDTPFQQLFEDLAVRREMRTRPNHLVVGGCGIGEAWLHVRRSDDQRQRTLTGLGLDPSLPTIYHNARYAVQHKGQGEMFRALLRVLDAGERTNILLHCLAPVPPDDGQLNTLAERHPELVRVRIDSMEEGELIDWAAASDLCLFPSKFEMDTFLLAMGEAMACGAVPIATAQRGMSHFGQAFDLAEPNATGLALPRSFRIDDPLLVDAIETGLQEMLRMVRTQPNSIAALRARAIAVARQFTWDRTAERLIAIFTACAAGTLPPPEPATLLARGWAELLTDLQIADLGEVAVRAAHRTGDLSLVHRLSPDIRPEQQDLFTAARARVDLASCHRIAAEGTDTDLAAALRGRASISRDADGVRVRWGFAPAARVEAILPHPAPSQPPKVVPLRAQPDGSFAGRVSGTHVQLALLVTLPDGRVVWDLLVQDDLRTPTDA